MATPKSSPRVPGDSARKMAKARSCAKHALMLDLPESVAAEKLEGARQTVRESVLAHRDRTGQQLWMRIDPLIGDKPLDDLAQIMSVASTNNGEDGSYSFVYLLARNMCLLGARAAGVHAIDSVLSNFRDSDALRAEVRRARLDGFTATFAFHPVQIEAINAGSASIGRWPDSACTACFGHPRQPPRRMPFAIGHNENDQGLPWLNQAMQKRGIYPERSLRLQQSFFPAEDWLVKQARGVERQV